MWLALTQQTEKFIVQELEREVIENLVNQQNGQENFLPPYSLTYPSLTTYVNMSLFAMHQDSHCH